MVLIDRVETYIRRKCDSILDFSWTIIMIPILMYETYKLITVINLSLKKPFFFSLYNRYNCHKGNEKIATDTFNDVSTFSEFAVVRLMTI